MTALKAIVHFKALNQVHRLQKMADAGLLRKLPVLAAILCVFLSVKSIQGATYRPHKSALEYRGLLENGLGSRPPMGWNNYNHFRWTFDERIVRETADAIVSTGLAKLGYEYVNIDPDMLEVGNGGMSLEEYRTHFSLWALMKAPLIMGLDVRSISQEYLDILGNKEVINVNQDSLGAQGKKVSKDGDLEVWAGPLSNGKHVVLLLNRGDSTAKVRASLKDIGVPANSSLTVRDVWEHKDLGKVAGSYIEANVGSHAVKMYILAPPS